MDVVISKVSSLFILAFATTVAGILPLKVKKLLPDNNENKKGRGDKILNAILAFSGGVLFSTIFIHLMPDVDAEFDAVLSQTKPELMVSVVGTSEPAQSAAAYPGLVNVKMPWGQLAVCIGFFLIYAMEELVEYFICRVCEEQHHHHADRKFDKDGGGGEESLSAVLDASSSLKVPAMAKSSCVSPVHGTHGAHREPHQMRDCHEKPRHDDSCVSIDDGHVDEKSPLLIRGSNLKSYHAHVHDDQEATCSKANGNSLLLGDNSHEHHVHNHAHSHLSPKGEEKMREIRKTMRGLMLIVALSFHSVFEGMAIGLQATTSGVWTSFAAVTMHKLVMAFCCGVELITLGTKRSIFLCSMVTFALICPIGIAIGIIVTEAMESGEPGEEKPSLTIASLQGLACGTLLYVTFFEVLTRTKGNEMSSLINFLAVLLGFALITGLHLLD